MTVTASGAHQPTDNGTLDPLPGTEQTITLDPATGAILDTTALDELRVSTRARVPTLTGEPTEAHDQAVQAALYARAVGYTRKVERATKHGVFALSEEIPPDPSAAMKWLAVRKPEQWAEKRTQEFRVIVARLGAGSERDAVGLVIEGDVLPALVDSKSDTA